MKNQRFANVWDAIEKPEDAPGMKLRSEMMIALHGYIKVHKLTQAQAAKILGITQPRVSDLVRGKVDVFSLDNLIVLAERAGLRIRLQIQEAA